MAIGPDHEYLLSRKTLWRRFMATCNGSSPMLKREQTTKQKVLEVGSERANMKTSVRVVI